MLSTKQIAPLLLAASLLPGCGRDGYDQKLEEGYTSQGNGVYIIKGGGDASSSEAFAKNLSRFIGENPQLEIETILPGNKETPFRADAIIITKPRQDNSSLK